jgi:hypothetical protein
MRPPVLDDATFAQLEAARDAKILAAKEQREGATFFGKTKRAFTSVRSLGSTIAGKAASIARSQRNVSAHSSRLPSSAGSALDGYSGGGGGGSGAIGSTDAGPISLADLQRAKEGLSNTATAILTAPKRLRRDGPKIDLAYSPSQVWQLSPTPE